MYYRDACTTPHKYPYKSMNMCANARICMYIHNTHTHARTYTFIYIQINVHTHTCTYVYTYFYYFSRPSHFSNPPTSTTPTSSIPSPNRSQTASRCRCSVFFSFSTPPHMTSPPPNHSHFSPLETPDAHLVLRYVSTRLRLVADRTSKQQRTLVADRTC